jgi:hypothetical protein
MSRDPPTELTELAVEDLVGAYLDLDEGIQSWFEYGVSMPDVGAVGVVSLD